MWPKNPSRVPGRAHTSLSASPTSRADAMGVGTQVPGGPLRTTANASTPISALAAPTLVNAVDHPLWRSNATNGTADRICPSWPTIVVSWVINGTRRGENHRGMSANVAAKTIASPVPTRTRAAAATGMVVACASRICPQASRTALATSIARGPKRSTSSPAGICATENTATWMNTKAARVPGLSPNRSAASRPAAARVVRCMTVRM